MATMDNLEELDNKALREKCLEYGLPNVPITDTSRKLLIRRLRTAMSAGDAAKVGEKPKSRRETIHIIKVEMESDKKEEEPKGTTSRAKPAASRRTIAAPIVREEKPVAAAPPALATVTQRRRSNRTTPISELESVQSFTSKRNYSDVIEESDDDLASIPMPVIIEKSPEAPRQVRAPSLSKSPIVTTSYVRDTPDRSVRDEESDEEEDDEEEEEDEDEEDYEPEVEMSGPMKTKYVPNTRSYDTTKPFSSVITKEPTYGFPSGRFESSTSRMSLSKAPTSTFSLDSSATRRYTTGAPAKTGGYQSSTAGGYQSKTGSENKTFAHRTDYKETSEEEPEPQYLSDFARRLSRLKAEPISSPLKQEDEPLKRTAPRYYASTVAGRRNVRSNDSLSESFNNFLIALDRKYHLKRNFTIAAIILTLVFIYILFF